ncbi:hypothetical protein V501_02172, partial [Pseudogymnoascus sp. VKM F-4519 (FW-2642)]
FRGILISYSAQVLGV